MSQKVHIPFEGFFHMYVHVCSYMYDSIRVCRFTCMCVHMYKHMNAYEPKIDIWYLFQALSTLCIEVWSVVEPQLPVLASLTSQFSLDISDKLLEL